MVPTLTLKGNPMFTPKPNKKYKGYLEHQSGKFFSTRRKAENYYLDHYAPMGWQAHGRGYWLIGQVSAALGWVDDNGDKHVQEVEEV